MSPPLLLLQDIHLSFGGTPLLIGAELSVHAGERVALVGRNGSGKSTLLRIAAGLVEPDRGTRFLQPGTSLRYLPQEPDLAGFANVLAYVEAGLGPGDDLYRARFLMNTLGLRGDEHPATLSGGEARRAAIARALAPSPDILLIDEPTNHLDLPALEWLESELAGSRSALALISHDRRGLERLSRATIWLDRGRTRRMERGFAYFEAWRDSVLAEEERERHKLDRKILEEEHWLRHGVSARRTRNQRRLADLETLRQKRRDHRAALGAARLSVAEAETSGALTIEARAVSKSYGATSVIRDFSIRVQRGDRIGIVGPNGAGKTTLLKLLTGQIAPDAGLVKLGANLVMASLDQRREALDSSLSLREALTEGRGDTVEAGGQRKHVIGYMRDFLFAPEQAGTPVGTLSGGERGRLMLAKALAKPSNLLVLDEPTNDLDLETLDLLQEMLADYPGTVILVSHDRDFLDRTVTSIVMTEGEGRWQDYAGGYSDMLAQRGAGVAARTTPRSQKETDPRRSLAPRTANGEERRKLSFKDKYALETLPGRMDRLHAEIAELRQSFDDPTLYARDPSGFSALSQALAQAQKKLAEAEDEWLRLELLREESEG